MLFELVSTLSMGAIASSAFVFQKKKESNDHEKIRVIADSLGLKTKNESIRLYRRNKSKNKRYTEYVYRVPLGISFKKFEKEKQTFLDGLNNRSRPDFNPRRLPQQLKQINWKQNQLKQIQSIFNKRVQLDKHIEMSYDGMLRIKVFEEGLTDMFPLTKEKISKHKGWTVPLGTTLTNTIVHDFEKSPHMLIGGATDMGKSTILNVIITTLLNNQSKHVTFTLIDLKGGLEFGMYENLKQTKHFACDIESAEEALKDVKRQMADDFQMLRRTGKKDVKQAGIKRRHFVIIDEAAELASAGELDADVKKIKVSCENYIKDIARRGRASGIRLLYSTQYPTTETVSSQVKRNLITRVCLPVDTSTASMVVLDEGGAEKLPLIQGRSIYKHHRTREMQASFISDELVQEIIEPQIDLNKVDKVNNKEGDSHAPFDVKEAKATRSYTVKFEET